MTYIEELQDSRNWDSHEIYGPYGSAGWSHVWIGSADVDYLIDSLAEEIEDLQSQIVKLVAQVKELEYEKKMSKVQKRI